VLDPADPLPLQPDLPDVQVVPQRAPRHAAEISPAASRPARLRTEGLSIEVRDLRFAYAPGESPLGDLRPPALDGVSFTVPAGGRVALVGPNGSGKSTIVSLLLRFWDYQEGTICIGGRELRTLRADDARALLGVVPQHTHLFNATIRDNLYLANPDASEEELVEACRQAQLHEFIQALPRGYDTLVGENGLLLSGGERQRLAIARALLKNAPILILDEATSHLDPLTEARVWQALEEFMAGRTTIVISHQRAALANVNQTISIAAGAVFPGQATVRSCVEEIGWIGYNQRRR
jgi:ABC-type multidrug transport system fused ATPase/permease subunit